MKKQLIMLAAILLVSAKSVRWDINPNEDSTVCITMKSAGEAISDAKQLADTVSDLIDEHCVQPTDMHVIASAAGCYRIRRSWADAKSQTGAYLDLELAVSQCPEGYTVYNGNGIAVYAANTDARIQWKGG